MIAGAGGTINFDRVGTVGDPNGGNFGTVEAIDGGRIDFTGGNGGNYGTQEAVGVGSTITFDLAAEDATQNNSGGTMEALWGGAIIVNGGTLDNSYNTSTHTAGTIEASSGGSVTVNGGTTNNSGGSIIEALSCGIVTFDDGATIHNSTGAVIEALCGGTVNFDGVTVDNYGGIIAASGHDAVVDLVDATINGGTLETSDCGIIQTVAGSGNSTFNNLTIAAGSEVLVNDGTSLTLQNTITDDGTIELVAGDPDLVIDGIVTLDGSGFVKLDGAGADIVGAATGSNTLDNNATIEGAGEIGNGGIRSLTLSNGGTIDANLTGETLTLDTGHEIGNTGTLEATNGGTLEIDDGVCNAGGTIAASGAGSVVELVNVTITGGTLELSGGGIIETPSGTSTLSGVTIDDGSILETNDGTFIDLESTTTLNGTVTFEGGGTFALDPGAAIVGGSGGGTLDIAIGATLSGSGDIGNAGATALTLNNSGTIDANVGGALLDIDTGATVTNTGTIEATNGGALEIDDSVNNYGASPGMIRASGGGTITLLGSAVNSGSVTAGVAGGTIEADACSSIEFDNVTIGLGSSVAGGGGTIDALGGRITINGGTANIGSTTVGGGGTVEASCNGSVTFNNVTINAAGATIEASHGGAITLDGGTLNDGSSTPGVAGGLVEATGCGSTITFEGTNTVNLGTTIAGGGGTVEATHGGAIIFDGSIVTDAGGTIEALCGGSILFEGEGSLDESSATAGIAGGIVEASGVGSTITFDNFAITLASAVCGGAGIIEASNGGSITFNGGTINSACLPSWIHGGTIEALTCGTINLNGTTVYNRNGSIEADGIGAMILLAGATIVGGTLETSAHGIIETVADSGNTTFDGVTIAAGSNVQVSDDSTLTLQDTFDCNGTVTNDGTITLVQGCHSSLIINGNITLAGSGTVVLSGDSDSIVGTGTGTNTLHNANTIEGSGTIGGDKLVFINQACGIVDADMCGHTLVLDTGSTVVNLGLLEATNGGTLEIDDSVCNVGGTIAASGHGSVVDLVGVTVNGGTLETSCDGLIETTGTSTLLNVTIADGSTLEAGTGATFLLEGTTTVSDPVTFQGGGTFELSGDHAKIVGSGGNADLHNYATIAGAGTIGNCALSLTNECSGVIDATGCLTINLEPNTLTNYGLMEATGGGELTLLSTVSNFNVIAAYAGSTVYLDDTVFNSDGGRVIASGHCAVVDLFNATIRGGTIESDCGGLIQTVAGWDGAATTSTFDGVTIGCGSDVKVADQTTLILEDRTTMSAGTLTIACSGVVDIEHGGNDGSGGATLDGVNVTDNGAIDIGDVNSGAILTLDDGTTITGNGTGTLTINANSTLDIEHGGNDGNGGATLDGVNVTDNGAIDIGDVNSGAILTLDDGTTITGNGTGTLTVNANSTLDIEHGGNDGNGGATLDGVNVTDNGAIDIGDVNSGAILTLDDGTTITGNGSLTVNANSTLDIEHGGNDGNGGATLDGVNVTDNGAIDIGDVNSGAILTLDDGTTITGNGTGTLTINFGNELDVEMGKSYCNNGATLDGVKVQDNGTIDIGAVATGAILTLDDGTTITGGGTAALTIYAGSTLDVENGPNGGGATLDDVHVTDNGALDIGDLACGAILTLEDDATITGGGIGTLTIHADNTLDVEHGINGGATLDGVNVTDNGAIDIGDVNSGAILTLDDGTTITGHGTGTLTINAGNTLDVEHGSNFDSGGATLDGVNVTDNGAIDIGDAGCGAILTLDDGTTITGNGIGTLTINAYNTLDIEHGGGEGSGGATLDGVNVTDNGAIDVGDVNSGAILTLDDGTTITGNGTGTLSINANNTLDVEHGGNEGSGGATLDGVHVTDNGAIDIGDVNSGAILTLDDATTITGNGTGTLTVNANSTLDIEHGGNDGNGGATLDGVHVTDNGAIDIGDAGSGAILTLDGGTSVSGCGAMTINAGNTLDVDGGTTTIDLGGTITNNGTLEASCGGELDVAGHVDNSSGMLEATSGGKLDIESAISGGSATIQGGTLEFGGKSNVDVAFNNGHGYGQLTLDHAEDFCGTISDFCGTSPDSAHSDVIDLKDINFDSDGFHECYDASTGMLTITDGSHTAYLKFEDFHGTFKFGSDGGTGTDIYDPPATGSKDAPSTSPTTPTTPTSAGGGPTAVPPDTNGSGNGHTVTSAPGTPPTLAENSLGLSGNDSFTFHPNLGNDAAHSTGAQSTELSHSYGQVTAPALAPIAPEFHQEFAFDVIHQDAVDLAAMVDHFHQMAANSALLH